MATEKDKIHMLALERFRILESSDHHNRIAQLDDLKFVFNQEEGQWPVGEREKRINKNRPCLTSNKLGLHVAQVANRERDQRISGKVRPVDDKADPLTAEIISGIIRQIEYASDADRIYTEAGMFAIASGSGYWRITTEELPDSFDQEIFIRRIENPFSVHLDPKRNYAFVREAMSKDMFNEKYPKFRKDDDFDVSSTGDDYTLWFENDKIFVAEYFYKVIEKIEIAEIINPLTQQVMVQELSEKVTKGQLESLGYKIRRTKKKKAYKVKWAKLSGHDVLEQGDWVGKDIPIIELPGKHVNIGGKLYKMSLIRDAKDPQRMYNVALSHNTEVVMVQPKAPYLVTKNQIGDNAAMWNRANEENFPYLIYEGKPGDKPRRELPPQISPGATALMQFSQEDIKDCTGLREASFGEKSNERTGVAIKSRANRSDFSTFEYVDNYRRAVEDTVKQLIDIIPKVVDTERAQRITGEDGAEMLVIVNQSIVDPLNPGESIMINDLSFGKYDIVRDTKVWSTRRQEQEEGMVAIASGSPQMGAILLPEIAKVQDWPNARELAEKIEQNLQALMGNRQPPGGGNTNPTGG